MWLITPPSEQWRSLENELGLSEVTAKILADRGINTVEAAEKFLNPDYTQLHPPLLLPDMETAVERIVSALANSEPITIYGDYDVDGQTSVVLLVEVLRSLAKDPELIHYYIPNRMDEGYGLHQEALAEISKSSSLVITVDCGVTAIAEADYARQIGLDLIITDHHEPKAQLPKAVAVINPKRADSVYPFAYLAGVGVAYKLVQALGEYYERDFRQWLDLVALGTVADLVPLVDENRIFVKLGLQRLENSTNLGLRALARVCQLKPPYKAADLGFKLGPRLNAVGRMGESARGVELLLSRDPLHARSLAQVLDQENRVRQETEAEIFQQAVAMLETNGWQEDPVIVVADHGWHQGVIGIVASRIVEQYYRPTVVISLEDGVGKGSARSITGFNLYEGLKAVGDLLLEFGGHEMAAGMTLEADKVPALRESLAEIVRSQLKPEDFIPKVRIDSRISIKDIDHQLLREFELLEPFGMGNPTPVLQVTGAVLSTRPMGVDQEHLRCIIQDQEGAVIEAVGFGMYQALQQVDRYREQVDFAVVPRPGYGDPTKIELLLRDFQAELEPGNFIEEWMWNRYPWQLSPDYDQLSFVAQEADLECTANVSGNIIDQRNVWNKIKAVQEHVDPQKRALIFAATPGRALELCRELRITIPNGSHIGFEHQLLSDEEREELVTLIEDGTISWIVSTGRWQPQWQWDQVVLYDACTQPALFNALIKGLKPGGCLIAVYGRDDCAWLQGKVRRLLPDRDLLAKFYLAMRRAQSPQLSQEQIDTIARSLNLREGVEFVLGVFSELGLIKNTANYVEMMPKPAQKLDLNASVLYNRGKITRMQVLTYLQHCLERGFLDELKGKNTSD